MSIVQPYFFLTSFLYVLQTLFFINFFVGGRGECYLGISMSVQMSRTKALLLLNGYTDTD